MDKDGILDIIERMRLARIGEYAKWDRMIRKIRSGAPLNPAESGYYSRMTRIYRNADVASRSRMYHTRLSDLDEKPACEACGEESAYYCSMNDQYFCTVHVVGHDENET